MTLATAGTARQGPVKDPLAPDPEKLGKVIATTDTVKPELTTGALAVDLAAPDLERLGTARPDPALALAQANPARQDIRMESLALDTSRQGTAMGSVVPVTLNPAIGETTLDSVINLTTADTATYPLVSSRSTAPALDHSTADAGTDLARETRGKCEELGWRCTGLLWGGWEDWRWTIHR